MLRNQQKEGCGQIYLKDIKVCKYDINFQLCIIMIQFLIVNNLEVIAMAKAASPVRLQDDLMKSAKVAGDIFHRSAAEQVEYWADIGRSVSRMIDSEKLVAIKAGLLRINVEPVNVSPIDPEAVFSKLNKDREDGTLAQQVSNAPFKYQISTSHPGYLEKIEGEKVIVGSFKNGEFVANNK